MSLYKMSYKCLPSVSALWPPGTELLLAEHAASFEKVVDNQREVILINLPKSSQQTSMESEEQSLRSSKDASASSWT